MTDDYLRSAALGSALDLISEAGLLEFIIPYLVVLDYLIIATSQFTFL